MLALESEATATPVSLGAARALLLRPNMRPKSASEVLLVHECSWRVRASSQRRVACERAERQCAVRERPGPGRTLPFGHVFLERFPQRPPGPDTAGKTYINTCKKSAKYLDAISPWWQFEASRLCATRSAWGGTHRGGPEGSR